VFRFIFGIALPIAGEQTWGMLFFTIFSATLWSILFGYWLISGSIRKIIREENQRMVSELSSAIDNAIENSGLDSLGREAQEREELREYLHQRSAS
jgi:hypothetical protein